MALIICPECEKSISSAAATCPHCGYPLCSSSYEHPDNHEISLLLSKIKQDDFICPPPRAKVCIKCGMKYRYGFDYNDNEYGTPSCSCSIEGSPYPCVEVDYPECDSNINSVLSTLWIYEEYVIPHNIGDIGSKEYITEAKKLYDYIKRGENGRKELGMSNWQAVKQPPNPSFFGVTPQQMMERRKSTQRPIYTPPAQKPSNVPTCPICKSTSLTKITVAKKAGKIALFGIFGAGDVGKTWKCNKCGSKF